MRESVKNAMRSGIVVIGAIAFGYLTLQLGFKPYLEKSQEHLQSLKDKPSESSSPDQLDDAHVLISNEGYSNRDS